MSAFLSGRSEEAPPNLSHCAAPSASAKASRPDPRARPAPLPTRGRPAGRAGGDVRPDRRTRSARTACGARSRPAVRTSTATPTSLTRSPKAGSGPARPSRTGPASSGPRPPGRGGSPASTTGCGTSRPARTPARAEEEGGPQESGSHGGRRSGCAQGGRTAVCTPVPCVRKRAPAGNRGPLIPWGCPRPAQEDLTGVHGHGHPGGAAAYVQSHRVRLPMARSNDRSAAF